MSTYDEQTLAQLIALLPPAPRAWVVAAQELAPARRTLDRIVERAREDLAYRQRVLADLEAALRGEGIEPEPRLVDGLRRQVADL
jgi:hypothetical protein